MPRDCSTSPCRRYRRVAVTYTVAREHLPPSWPTLSSPEAAADFARELLADQDDDREHVWFAPGSARGLAQDGKAQSACMYPASSWSLSRLRAMMEIRAGPALITSAASSCGRLPGSGCGPAS
jgi:hypothetical protein